MPAFAFCLRERPRRKTMSAVLAGRGRRGGSVPVAEEARAHRDGGLERAGRGRAGVSVDVVDPLYPSRCRVPVAKAFPAPASRRAATEDAAPQARAPYHPRTTDGEKPPVERWSRPLHTSRVPEPRRCHAPGVPFGLGRHDGVAPVPDVLITIRIKDVSRRRELGMTPSSVQTRPAEAGHRVEPLRRELCQLGVVEDEEGGDRG